MDTELEASTRRYLDCCFSPEDKKQIQDLLDAKDYEEIRRRMLPRISFGTSGLRGRMEAGYARMNDLTVFEASVGLRNYVLETVPDAATRGIVIGHDHRHHSEGFAAIVRSVFQSAMKVHFFGGYVHTPLVPFTVKELHAACGVMITASHNPKLDNGYKVYWQNGCAIIPPHDHGIAAAIKSSAGQENPDLDSSQLANDTNFDKEMASRYFAALQKTVKEIIPDSDFQFAYTAMHGVGMVFALRVAELLGLASPKNLMLIEEQMQPDPDFPTVKFPNPEEHGALDLAIRAADERQIGLIIATDPDADRMGVAEKVDGFWRQFTGDQIGYLLANEMIKRTHGNSKRAMLSSAVSSRLLKNMAKNEGIHWEETLTGFKWLGNRALDLQEQGYQVIFCYEEAIGFMPYTIVFDKDGILSMSVLLALARELHKQGRSLFSQLEEIQTKHGYFASANSYFTINDPKIMLKVMSSLRKPEYPTILGHRKVSRIRDLTEGYDSAAEDKKPVLPVSKSSEMITFWFEPGPSDEFILATMTVRGSGTEPKLKYYIEAQASSMLVASHAAQAIEKDFETIWLKQFDLIKQEVKSVN